VKRRDGRHVEGHGKPSPPPGQVLAYLALGPRRVPLGPGPDGMPAPSFAWARMFARAGSMPAQRRRGHAAPHA
jgi:hypothetical protein